MQALKTLAIFCLLALLFSCQKAAQSPETSTESRFKTPEDILNWMENPTDDYVMVVAHRGDWRNAPENSLRAVANCMEMGVEIVEIDIRMTKDSQLVIMHDLTLDRTTTGKGKIADWTLDSIRTLNLKNGANGKTAQKVPTLEEMLLFVKDKPVLLNLDKAWDYLPQTFALLQKTGTVQQGLFKGNNPLDVMRKQHGSIMDSIHYMPIVWPMDYSIYEREKIVTPMSYVEGFISRMDPIAFEVVFDKEDSPVLETIPVMQENKVAVWINTLWAELCAGHHDELAIDNPDAHWGWVIERGANIIQTDRPARMIEYLKSRDLR